MVDVKKTAPVSNPAPQIDRTPGSAPAPQQTPPPGQSGNPSPKISDFQRITGASGGRVGFAGRAARMPQIEVNGVRDTAAGHFARIEEFGEVKIPTPVLEHLLYS